MRITDSKHIYEALIKNEDFDFDSQGNIESHSHSGFSKFFLRSTPQPPHIDDKMLLGLAGIIEQENVKKQGPQALTQELYHEEGTFEETLAKAKTLLACSMIQNHVEKYLKDKPMPIITGVSLYIQSLWKHTGKEPLFPEIKIFVEKQIAEFEAKELLGTLACGFVLGPKDLKNNSRYLEENLIETVKNTWSEKNKKSFDDDGVYDIFKKDSGRDRPYIFESRVDHSVSNEEAGEIYGKLLSEGFKHERSMTAVTSILMSQTSMVTHAEMIMGIDTPFPLNSYEDIYRNTTKELLTIVAANEPTKPRSTLIQNGENIFIRQLFTVAITNINNGHTKPVGELTLLLTVPKSQFPLGIGEQLNITVSEMVFDRKKGFTE